MNLSTAIFLVEPSVRSVRVSYEPDIKGNPGQLFKTLDPSIVVGDLVIVPTQTRHKMTVCKVEEIDFGINFDSPTEYAWIIGRVDTATYNSYLDQENQIIAKVRQAEENRKRLELATALGLQNVDLSGFSILSSAPPLPAPSTPKGAV